MIFCTLAPRSILCRTSVDVFWGLVQRYREGHRPGSTVVQKLGQPGDLRVWQAAISSRQQETAKTVAKGRHGAKRSSRSWTFPSGLCLGNRLFVPYGGGRDSEGPGCIATPPVTRSGRSPSPRGVLNSTTEVSSPSGRLPMRVCAGVRAGGPGGRRGPDSVSA